MFIMQLTQEVFIMKDYADLHTHTIASGHAYGTITEMVHAAALKGLPILGITEHAPSMPGTCTEMQFCNFTVIPPVLEGVRLLFGCELNIVDYKGTIDLSERMLKRLSYTIASLHDLCLKSGTKEENTHSVLEVLKNPYVTILGHPDDGKFPLDYEAVVKAAKEHHKMIELNNTSLSPNSSRIHAEENDRIILPLCAAYKVPVIMNSDAHFTTAVGDHHLSEALLKAVDFPEELIANYHPEILKEYIPALADFTE